MDIALEIFTLSDSFLYLAIVEYWRSTPLFRNNGDHIMR